MRIRSGSYGEGASGFNWVRTDMLLPGLGDLTKHLLDRWRQAVASRLGNPDLIRRYYDGMDLVVDFASGKTDGIIVRFKMKGMWAPALELGWAPTGPNFMDGVGQYNGNIHDMRTFLLGDGREYRPIPIYNSLSDIKPSRAGGSPLDYLIAKMKQAHTSRDRAKPGSKYSANPAHDQTKTEREVDEWEDHRRYTRRDMTGVPRSDADRSFSEEKLHDEIEDTLREYADLPINRFHRPKAKTWFHRRAKNQFVLTAPHKAMIAGRALGKKVIHEHTAPMQSKAYIARQKSVTGGDNGDRAMLTIRTVSRNVKTGWKTRGFPPADTITEMTEYATAYLTELMAAAIKEKGQ